MNVKKKKRNDFDRNEYFELLNWREGIACASELHRPTRKERFAYSGSIS